MSYACLLTWLKLKNFQKICSGPIARVASTAFMHQLKQNSWQDARILADNRVTYPEAAVLSGLVTVSPHSGSTSQLTTNITNVMCKWFNDLSINIRPFVRNYLTTNLFPLLSFIIYWIPGEKWGTKLVF